MLSGWKFRPLSQPWKMDSWDIEMLDPASHKKTSGWRPWTHSHLWNLWKKSPESGKMVPVYTSHRVFRGGKVTSDFVALMYQLASDIQVASNEKRILCPSLPIFLTHQENPSGSLDRTARNAHSPQIESEYGCIDWLTLKNRWNLFAFFPNLCFLTSRNYSIRPEGYLNFLNFMKCQMMGQMHLFPTNPKAFMIKKGLSHLSFRLSRDERSCGVTKKCHLPEVTWLRSECQLFSWRAQPQIASSQT